MSDDLDLDLDLNEVMKFLLYCVYFGKLLKFFKPQIPHLKLESKIKTLCQSVGGI